MNRGRPVAYVDSSVLIASIGNESYGEWARGVLARKEAVSSAIAKVELARFAHRMGQLSERLRSVMSTLSFVKVEDQAIAAATAVSGEVKALDALHVGTWAHLKAVGVECPFITLDRKQAAAASRAGATVLHPFGDLR
ncbi:PIN domain-containing protein [Corynebacterium sp. Marseille-P4321]|uniref:type II toxin-antitoxin system VapC family toxin n=1 Tax=Corynebacterium sp. Marseille-P4321 TaxID=2736603 RepID=UPI0020CA46FD|nr:PIN domain-containing protein [Corynebacterium sp. Marseille-P4321]